MNFGEKKFEKRKKKHTHTHITSYHLQILTSYPYSLFHHEEDITIIFIIHFSDVNYYKLFIFSSYNLLF